MYPKLQKYYSDLMAILKAHYPRYYRKFKGFYLFMGCELYYGTTIYHIVAIDAV